MRLLLGFILLGIVGLVLFTLTGGISRSGHRFDYLLDLSVGEFNQQCPLNFSLPEEEFMDALASQHVHCGWRHIRDYYRLHHGDGGGA